MNPRWQAASDLEFHSWNDECVVYCDTSGDTMLLEPLAATLLRHLMDGPANLDELQHAAASVVSSEESQSAFLDVFYQLIEAGVIERTAE